MSRTRIDATGAANHIDWLRSKGLTYRQIAHLADVTIGTIRYIAIESRRRTERGQPPATATPATVTSILTITPPPAPASDPVRDTAWIEGAPCASTDPDLYHPDKGETSRDAQRVCGCCDVRTECLEWALATNQTFGVWGGMNQRQRLAERRRRLKEAA